MKKNNRFIVFIEESKERLIVLGVEPCKISIVKNTPVNSMIHNVEKISQTDDDFFQDKDRLVILYNGQTNPTRGVLDPVRSFPKIVEKFPGIRLVINGKGYDDNEIYNAIDKFDLADVVHHMGWGGGDKIIQGKAKRY